MRLPCLTSSSLRVLSLLVPLAGGCNGSTEPTRSVASAIASAKAVDSDCTQVGALTWCPTEDVSFSDDATREHVAIAGAEIATTERERLLGTITWNESGEALTVVDVNEDAWVNALDAYDDALTALGDGYARDAAASPSSRGASLDAELADAEAYGEDAGADLVRTGWVAADCGGGLGGPGIGEPSANPQHADVIGG